MKLNKKQQETLDKQKNKGLLGLEYHINHWFDDLDLLTDEQAYTLMAHRINDKAIAAFPKASKYAGNIAHDKVKHWLDVFKKKGIKI